MQMKTPYTGSIRADAKLHRYIPVETKFEPMALGSSIYTLNLSFIRLLKSVLPVELNSQSQTKRSHVKEKKNHEAAKLLHYTPYCTY